MRMLLELSKQPALLELHIEALQGAVDRLIGLDGNVNQAVRGLRKSLLWQIAGLLKQSSNQIDPRVPLQALVACPADR